MTPSCKAYESIDMTAEPVSKWELEEKRPWEDSPKLLALLAKGQLSSRGATARIIIPRSHHAAEYEISMVSQQ